MKRFVDTNIFVYSLFPIDLPKLHRCKKLFSQAQAGEIDLWTTEWVISELVWVLVRYKLTIPECKQVVMSILTTEGLEVKNREWILEVLEMRDKIDDFIDAVHLVNAKRESVIEIYSFDKGFDQASGFVRREP